MVEWVVAILKGVKVIPGLASLAEWVLRRHRLAGVARDLIKLTFWNGGITESLQRIADGKGGPGDLAEIAGHLKQNKAEIIRTGDRLKAARDDFIPTDLGTGTTRDLDAVIYMKLGRDGILPRLEQLVEANDCSSKDAKDLLKKIENFNRHLDKVHEAIRPNERRSGLTAARRPPRTPASTGTSQ